MILTAEAIEEWASVDSDEALSTCIEDTGAVPADRV